MAADLVARARQRREHLVAELARIDSFLKMAAELERDFDTERSQTAATAPRAMARRGAGAATVAAALEIVRLRGPLPTRDLVPLIEQGGIVIGGKSKVATLSARLSTSGKGQLRMRAGRWHESTSILGAKLETALAGEESADPPDEEESADSLFN